jgi:hypothetical protein
MSFREAVNDFRQLHLELMPRYNANCVLVAERVGSMLIRHDVIPSFLRLKPLTPTTQLVPKTAPHLSWPIHVICTALEEGRAFAWDPVLPGPTPLFDYADAFTHPIEWEPFEGVHLALAS